MKEHTGGVAGWRQDTLFKSILKNSSYLLGGSTISMGISALMGLLVPLLLTPAQYGVLGMVIMYASSVNRLLSFRMGELVIKYAGGALAGDDKAQAAAVIKVAGLAEALTSVAAYALLALTAPLAARFIIKDASTTGWILLYGLALLANIATESATAVLQISNRYRIQAALNLTQTVITALVIGLAFLTGGGFGLILVGYLLGKLVYGLGMLMAAWVAARHTLGSGWYTVRAAAHGDRREMIRFAISTNLSSTLNMLIRDSEVLWVGYFLSAAQAGYYKLALAVMNVIVMPVTPLISTTFPEISAAVARGDWGKLRSMLKRTSTLAFAFTAAFALGFVLFGRWFFGFYGGGQYLPAYPAILILLAGYGVANVFFWNRPLMLALGRPNEPLWISGVAGVIKTVLMFVLVRPFGYLAQAALLSAYFVISIGALTLRGLRAVGGVLRSEMEESA